MDDADLSPHKPAYYIAIGASAGGLEALQEFFQHMPHDSGATFIVIQHLSPDFKSVMGELLGRATKMQVLNARDGIEVRPDNVYLIPPRKNMMIAEGKLLLVDQLPERGINFPIDVFFRALAEDQHHHTISIVLSGTGSDGSRGIQAVKEVGGLVIIQDPRTAQFDGMPRSAEHTGLADVILAPKDMPAKLMNYMTHPMINGRGQPLIDYVESNDAALKDIFELLKQRSEIDFSQYKPTTVARRIERRIGINQLESLQEYHKLILRSPDELQTLAKDMLIGVTRFFRDSEMFATLEKRVIPDILERVPDDESIRIWVAGCSTGEEAYSIAILFAEAIQKRGESRNVKIFATDVDPDAIAEAGSGQYALNIKDDIDEKRLAEYFVLEHDHYSLRPAIRQMVVFAVHNLIKDPPFSSIHLACCRNVLIYFQADTQKRVLSLLHFSLQKGGFLFLGPSETLGDLKSHFSVEDERCRLFRKVVNTRIATDSVLPPRSQPEDNVPTVPALLRSYRNVDRFSPAAKITDALISNYAPPCIVLNSNYEIVHVYGDASDFTRSIKAGRFSANIKDIVSEDLSIAVSTALHRAKNSEEDVHYQNVQYHDQKGELATVDLKILYLKDPSLHGGIQYLLIFESSAIAPPNSIKEVIDFNLSDQSQQRIRDLENELQNNQEHLQVTVEELETTNEELQSSNEELMAANEELQSTNEELQSVNEELYTVNSEYQQKIEELTQVNSDLDNILRSTKTGIILLDEAMLIRNHTPVVAEYLNIVNSDVGRPLHHISHNLKYSGLLDSVASVIDGHVVIEKEVKDDRGRSILLSIAPYITDKNEPRGCVISFTDISEVRRLQGALAESYQELRATISQSLNNRGQQLRLLLVDDSDEDLKIVRTLLAEIPSMDLTIHDVSNSGDAEKILLTKKIDICFMDFRLEGITGIELIRDLSKSGIRSAFILLSGQINAQIQDEAMQLGIYDCVDKDVLSPALLEHCIRYTLRHKQTEEYLARQESSLVH